MKRLPAVFYQLPSGREPVREWLKSFTLEDRKIIGEDSRMVLLHAFVKKTQKTPPADLELATKRKKEIT